MTKDAAPLAARIHQFEAVLSEAMMRVARFFEREPIAALSLSAAQVASATGTSDATVVRTAKALGFAGLADLRATIATTLSDDRTPAANMLRTLAEVGEDSLNAIDTVIETHGDAIQALAQPDMRQRLSDAVATLAPAANIVIFGIGQTSPLAGYAAILLNRAGRQTLVCDASGIALADQLLRLRPGDAILAMAYGKAYPEIETLFHVAGQLGLPIVLISDSLDTDLARHAKVVVPARRGRANEVALHAVTLAALEAIALGLAASAPERAIDSLVTLGILRDRIRGKKRVDRRLARSRRQPARQSPAPLS